MRAITTVMEKAPDGKERQVTKYGNPEALEKAMLSHARLVVYGEPGGGKTTLTQQRALGLLTSEFLPVRVLAKAWAVADEKKLLSLHDYLTLHYPETVGFYGEEAKTLGALLWSEYEAGRVALFVDALDETERRGELCEHLRRLPVRGKLVFTCRSAFMGERNLPEIPRFLTAGLTRAAALAYIDQRPGTTRKAEFRALLEGDSPTAKLIGTPLCLAMVLQLFDAGKYAPPANRDVLYAEYTAYALDTKQRQKPAPILEEHQIDPRQSRFFDVHYKIAILEHFAYARRFDNQPADTTTLAASIATVAEQRVWERRAYNDLLFQADVLTDILQHSGILFTPSDGSMGAGAPLTWLHQTFEEYLAAGELARRWEQDGHPLSHNEPPVILFAPQARETVLLAVGRLKPSTTQNFLEAIAACPPLCDFGLQALSRRIDASQAMLEAYLSNFLNLTNHWDIPKHGLTALTIAVKSNLISWAIDNLLSRFDSVAGGNAGLVQEAIAAALEMLFVNESIESLLSRLDSITGENTGWIQTAITNTLGLLFVNESIESLFSRFDSVSGDSADWIRYAIVTALGTIGDSQAIDGLLSRFDSIFGDGTWQIRCGIASALGTIGDSQAIDGLLSRFDSISGSHDEEVRRAIGSALEMLFVSESIKSLFSRFDSALGENAWMIRYAIVSALGTIGDSHAIDGLIFLFDSIFEDNDEWIREAIVSALGTLFVSEPIESLFSRFDSALVENAWGIQKAVATALGIIGDSRVIEGLFSRFDSVSGEHDYLVQQSIATALGIIGDSCVIEGLFSRFDSVSGEHAYLVQQAIANALGTIGDNCAIDSLLSRFDTLSGENVHNVHSVRHAIATALGDIGLSAVPSVWEVWRDQKYPEETRNEMEKVLFKLGTFSPELEERSPAP